MPGMLSFAIPNIIIEITNATPAEINTVGVNPVIWCLIFLIRKRSETKQSSDAIKKKADDEYT